MGKLIDEMIEKSNRETFFDIATRRVSKSFQFISNSFGKLIFNVRFPRFNRIGPTTLSDIYKIFGLTESEINKLVESYSISCDLPVFYGAKFGTVQKSVLGSIQNMWGPVYTLCDGIKLFGLSTSIEEDPKGFKFNAVVIWASESSKFAKSLKRINAFDVLGSNLKI